MPTTRSASKKQARYKTEQLKPIPKTSTAQSNENMTRKEPKPRTNMSRKRKAPTNDKSKDTAQKKSNPGPNAPNQAHFSGEGSADLEKPIIINRSPVLQLWGASVANFLHPKESWETCLSIGGQIAALCAVSKGRAIGHIGLKDESVEAEKKREKRKSQSKGVRTVTIMGFPMHVKDDVVVVDGKPKPLKEDSLKGKFGGEENYNKTKQTMQDALQTWHEEGAELEKKAFHMYEKFRPAVASGAAGWGRKGELNLHRVASTIER